MRQAILFVLGLAVGAIAAQRPGSGSPDAVKNLRDPGIVGRPISGIDHPITP